MATKAQMDSLSKLQTTMTKKFGTHAVMRASDMPPTKVVPSGSLSLDIAMGVGGVPTNRVIEVIGAEGGGKALSLDTPLATPDGWTTMEKIHVGDQVFDERGQPTTVLGVYDVNPDKSYDVFFNDGSSIRACEDHLWTTWDQTQREQHRKADKTGEVPENWPVRGRTLSTSEMLGSLSDNHCVFVTEPLVLPDADLLIHPWVLGYWLGNGAADSGRVTCSLTDESHIKNVIRQSGYETNETRHVKGGGVSFTVLGLKVQLRELGVLGDKHVPSPYLRASEEQRAQFVSGLMDSDGHQDNRGHAEFGAKGREFISQVSELLVSLGQKPVLNSKEAFIGTRSYGVHYRLYFNPTRQFFTVPSRAQGFRPVSEAQGLRRQHRMVKSVQRVENEPMRCIMVDSPNHLYLAGRSMIPTHNTTLGLLIMKQLLEADPTRHAMFFDFEHKLTTEWVVKLVGEEIMERMLYMQPDHAEEGINMYVEAMKSGAMQSVIWDSIASAPSLRAMKDGADAEVKDVGGNAGAITTLSRIASTLSSKYDCQFLGINQLRANIGAKVPTAATANSPGGLAWRHHCIARIEVKRTTDKFMIKQHGEEIQVGYGIKAKIFKNQLAAPFRTATWNFFNVDSEEYGPVGIDTTEECLRLARVTGAVDVQPGGMYHHPALPGGKVRGEDSFKKLVRNDPTLKSTIVSEVMAKIAEDKTLAGQISPIEEDLDSDLLLQAMEDQDNEPDMVGSGVVGGRDLFGAKNGN